jgi:hypothetical protein
MKSVGAQAVCISSGGWVDLAATIKTLFSKFALVLALSRGGTYFFADSSLYAKSNRVTQEIRATFGKPVVDLGGKAFRRASLARLFISTGMQRVDAVLIARLGRLGRLGNSVVRIINVVNQKTRELVREPTLDPARDCRSRE